MIETPHGKLYLSTELPNEEYHAMPGIGGSALAKIFFDCLYGWKYAEQKETKSLEEGTASHCVTLEESEFLKRYARGINPDDYPDALTTNKSIEAFLKDRGRKGYSGKTKDGLIQMVEECLIEGEKIQILEQIIDRHRMTHVDKTILDHKVFDRIIEMRQAVFSDPIYARKLDTAQYAELSYIDEDGRKCRWDLITADEEIWDYKTCRESHPVHFSRNAYTLGYWLKMAYQADLYERAFGRPPNKVVLLAQSKTKPFIAQAYYLTDEQLRVGREQYQTALAQYRYACETGNWENYGGGVQELLTPGFAAYENDMNLDEIAFIDD